ncbi:hypothetical protein K3495_g3827 [Podosphaera aphanis]|nr:hypothetical protein K3495_g3827 [Podosphaera aphanis]
MASAASDVPPYLPAWKKLGLKLKLQEETLTSVASPCAHGSSKRKRNDSGSEDNAIRKAQKLIQEPRFGTTRELMTPNFSRKKSVTFTPETKLEDGDSVKTIFNSWVTGQNSKAPSIERTNFNIFNKLGAEPVAGQQTRPSVEKKKEKRRTSEKPKSGLAKSSAKSLSLNNVNPSTAIPPFLKYLRQYHDSRDTWKFNKNHQSHLLQHVFDVNIVPSDQAHFIYAYIKGLQGNVRTRLRDAALSIKVKDIEDGPANFPENTPDSEEKQKRYESALTEYLAFNTISHTRVPGHEEKSFMDIQDKLVNDRLIKRTRAEMILTELASSPDASMLPSQKSLSEDQDVKVSDALTKKISRKRKRRTATDDSSSSSSSDDSSSLDESSTSDDSSSSDESSSSDDSVSSSEILQDVKSIRAVIKKSNNPLLNSDSSLSSSSTSDSGSDSDSD